MIGALACVSMSAAAQSAASTATSPAAAGPTIRTDDVERFYNVQDAAGGHPTADQLQHDYVDPGRYRRHFAD